MSDEMSHVDKAWSNPDSPLKQSLDFAPFATALADLSDKRIAEIGAMLIDTTVNDIQALFAARRLTSAELTLYYLRRIQRYDRDRHNSVLELNPEALTIAHERDDAFAMHIQTGALHGIPILLKGNIGTGDAMHTTAGAVALAEHKSDRDAFIVTQLREAGAVILGKANLSEWAYFMNRKAPSGYSALGGHTRNAYGRFDCGGSSSGSGVATSAEFCTLAIGTETAGSLISPATQNGLCTIKPSLGLVSRDRIVPITAAQDTAGPLTRTLTDLAILLSAMAGPDENDAITQEATPLANTDFTQYLNADGLAGLQIGLVIPTLAQVKAMEEKPWYAAGMAESEALLAQAVAMLEAAGATVRRVAYEPHSIQPRPAFFMGMKHDLADYLVATNAPVRSVTEVVAFNAENLAERAQYGQGLLIDSAEVSASRAEYEITAFHNRKVARTNLRRQLKRHKVDLFLSVANWSTAEYCTAGTPAVCVPIGFRPSGEPQSITFFADYLEDGKLIAAAYAFEQIANLRVSPTLA